MCLHRLHRDLMLMEVNAKTVDEIVSLISYTYQSTRRRSVETGPVGEALRDLVKAFVKYEPGILSQQPKFDDLLGQCDEFAIEFPNILMEYIAEFAASKESG